jgi:hypothetical protein
MEHSGIRRWQENAFLELFFSLTFGNPPRFAKGRGEKGIFDLIK